MSWQRRLLRLMLPASLLPLLLSPVWAQLQGNQYSNPVHHVTFACPDDTWRFLEAPSQGNAVAAFSNSDGQAIALLVHRPLVANEAIASEKDLNKRWTSLADEIIAIVNTGESSPMIETSTHGVTADAATFEIIFRSVSPGGGEILKNWVTGIVVRDPSDQQHIYAVRCAAPEPAFNAWQADFSQIMGTLRYEGERRAPVFLEHSLPVWQWAVPLLAIGILLVLLRMRSRARATAYRRRMEANIAPKTSEADHTPDQFYATGGLPVAPTHEDSSSLLANIPDQMVIPNSLGRPSSFASTGYVPAGHGMTDAGASADAQTGQAVAVHPEVPANFWTCACGRINPNTYEFCARCNADKVKK